MIVARTIATALVVSILPLIGAAQQAQTPAPTGRGRIGGIGIGAYPERKEDQAAVERGRSTFSTNCAFCHGADIRGGDGGPSLLRSQLVLDDHKGELIGPVIRAGRPDRGMPAFAMTAEQIGDVAAFMHSFRVAGYDASRDRPPSIVVGNAATGEKYFTETCGSCHSATGDLQGLATRISDPRLLQQSWLMPGSVVGRGAPPPARPRPPTATVTLPAGEKIQGELERVDDFVVALKTSDGGRRSFRIANGVQVSIADPLQPHRDLLRKYRDADIHDVTAYLSTLK
jgi:cytochrome c oxidase cbb3-type subunit III